MRLARFLAQKFELVHEFSCVQGDRILLFDLSIGKVFDQQNQSVDYETERNCGREAAPVPRRVSLLPDDELQPRDHHVLYGVDGGDDKSPLLIIVGADLIRPCQGQWHQCNDLSHQYVAGPAPAFRDVPHVKRGPEDGTDGL